jgi:hypothetical protein
MCTSVGVGSRRRSWASDADAWKKVPQLIGGSVREVNPFGGPLRACVSRGRCDPCFADVAASICEGRAVSQFGSPAAPCGESVFRTTRHV